MKKSHRFILGAVILAAGFVAWPWIRSKPALPDSFFADFGMNVPVRFIVSHDSPWMLLSMNEYLVLKIPNAQVAAVQKTFAAQSDFNDASANLPLHYAQFRAGEEQFFPKSCPQRFQAGRFSAQNREREVYFCRFLFDRDNANFTTLYLSSVSPTN